MINIFSMIICCFWSVWWCISCMFWVTVFKSWSKTWFLFYCVGCLIMMSKLFDTRLDINIFWVLFRISKTWHAPFISCLWLSNWIFYLIRVFELITWKIGFLCLWRRIIILSKCILTKVVSLSPADAFLLSRWDSIWLLLLYFWFF